MDDTITFYNMGFGDASIISNVSSFSDSPFQDGESPSQNRPFNLLIDFGSKNSVKNGDKLSETIKNACSDIVKRMSRKDVEQNLLITHFHIDHTKFISMLKPNSIDNIYIRDIYRDAGAAYIFNLAKLFYDAPTDKAWEEAWKALKTIPSILSLLKSDGQIHFVGEGSKIRKGNLMFNVLSPSRDEFHKHYKKTSNLKKRLTESDNKMISSFISEYDGFMNFISGKIEGDDREKISFIRNSQNLKGFFSDIFSEERYSTIKDAWRSNKGAKKRFADLEHDFNIVLEEPNKRLLLCGDEKSNDMVRILKKRKENDNSLHYYITKFPHHGTSSHFILANGGNGYLDFHTRNGFAPLSKMVPYGDLDVRYSDLSDLLLVSNYESFCRRKVDSSIKSICPERFVSAINSSISFSI